MMNVFQQLKLTWVVLVPVAAPFWIGDVLAASDDGGGLDDDRLL